MYQSIGAIYLDNNSCQFTVWSPLRKQVNLQIVSPEKRSIPLKKKERGYWQVTVDNITPETRYFYELDGELLRPDPASHFQPNGVHEASQVVDHNQFDWQDQGWNNINLEDWIIYELHPGTFTPEGTFEAIIDRLPYLKDLGINIIELMPVGQFPGKRNWGYDGAYWFAVQNSYGGPNGLKKLVNACHQQGIGVILDVIYNHFGPEGNYTQDFGPYFTQKYKTPWGSAINYDDAYSDGVRNVVIQNALYWLDNYHIDGLRLDAIHAIYDFSAKHILKELAEAVETLNKKVYLIAESDLNDVKIIDKSERGGYNIDAQWSDDFHHCLHTLLTKENKGYYQDFSKLELLAKVLKEGFAYSGDYSPFRKRYHGNSAIDCPPYQFVVCNQNHDQVGNRMLGERFSQLISFEQLKIAAGLTLLSPYIPLLFMGEEYGEDAPFLYFIDHNDPGLIEAVREGRKEEFNEFYEVGDPPDAASLETFKQSTLDWEKQQKEKHKTLYQFYQSLINLRRQIPALAQRKERNLEVETDTEKNLLKVTRYYKNSKIMYWVNFDANSIIFDFKPTQENWHKQLDSSDEKWLGKGAKMPKDLSQSSSLEIPAYSIVVYETR